MGVLIISGSPRENGNTSTLLSILNTELQKCKVSTEFVSLHDKKINHCLHCDKCVGINRCIQNDDFNSIYERMLYHEGLVVGSPVYVGAPSSLLLALIQRATYVSFSNGCQLSRKIGGPVAVGGESGRLTAINCLADFFLVNEMIMPGSRYWNIGVGTHKGDVEKDEKGKSYIIRFGQNLAWLMKRVGKSE